MHDAGDYSRSCGNPRQYELAIGDVSELVGNLKRSADRFRGDRAQQIHCVGLPPSSATQAPPPAKGTFLFGERRGHFYRWTTQVGPGLQP